MTAIIVGPDKIASQVYEAIEDEKYLKVGVKNTLELLDEGYDGIFETPKAWRGFIFGNFAEYAEKGTFWLEGECKESTIKKWCCPLDQYKGRFVQQIGKDRYCWVKPEDLDFKFTFDTNFYSAKSSMKLPCCVEIFVTATIKED